ncbi:hypothetical protein B0T20DRAFT_36988 [Sordaria brevicollis]|uniref:Uncharacterized protein n=1 Tax=Sordaria brevicollis TaxID=83679 RepID=A0AAE0U9J7_SORBR|nr:hypothetical protein B0T20DRAFT_36988 [Sordaria brevicollis]
MLLTSAQVSIAFSSGIVFIFTAALFLSGYAIQQRTVRDLRQAIRPNPKPSPKTYLPDQFKKITAELPDGNLVPVRQQDDRRVVVEIKPTLPKKDVHETLATAEEESRQKPIAEPDPGPKSTSEKKAKNKKTSSARAQKYREQQLKKKKQQKEQEGLLVQQGQQQPQNYSPTSDEAERQGSVEIPEGMLEHPDPEMRAEKAVSPAERRRLIKEEIKRLAQPEERGYYQRRLW